MDRMQEVHADSQIQLLLATAYIDFQIFAHLNGEALHVALLMLEKSGSAGRT